MSVVKSETIYGMDYRSNIHLFDSEKEKKAFYRFMGTLLGLNRQSLDELISDISNKYKVDEYELYRLDNYFQSLYYLCQETENNYDNYEDAIHGLYIFPFNSLICCRDIVSDNSYVVNPILGMNLYTLLRRNKEDYKAIFTETYNYFEKILKDNVTMVDIIDSFKYHTIIEDTDIDHDIHIVSDKL